MLLLLIAECHAQQNQTKPVQTASYGSRDEEREQRNSDATVAGAILAGGASMFISYVLKCLDDRRIETEQTKNEQRLRRDTQHKHLEAAQQLKQQWDKVGTSAGFIKLSQQLVVELPSFHDQVSMKPPAALPKRPPLRCSVVGSCGSPVKPVMQPCGRRIGPCASHLNHF